MTSNKQLQNLLERVASGALDPDTARDLFEQILQLFV